MPATAAVERPLHLNKREAAEFLGVSVRTLDRLPIARVKIRGSIKYRRDTLDAWSKANEAQPEQ
jgi:hypothetical protein